MKEWKLIYDSKETEEEIVATDEIDVSGCSELMVLCRVVATANNSASRNGVIIITDENGKKRQLEIGALVTANSNPRLSKTMISKISDYVISDSILSWNSSDLFNTDEPVGNMSNVLSAMVKSGNIKKIYITNLNQNPSFFFGIGSRFVVYGK